MHNSKCRLYSAANILSGVFRSFFKESRAKLHQYFEMLWNRSKLRKSGATWQQCTSKDDDDDQVDVQPNVIRQLGNAERDLHLLNMGP